MIKVREVAIVSATVRIVIVALADIGIGTALCLFLLTQNDNSRLQNLLLFSYILDLLFKILFPCAEEDFFHYGGAEGYEGVEVMESSEHGVIGADGDEEDEHS